MSRETFLKAPETDSRFWDFIEAEYRYIGDYKNMRVFTDEEEIFGIEFEGTWVKEGADSYWDWHRELITDMEELLIEVTK